jgi:hypothetical protein
MKEQTEREFALTIHADEAAAAGVRSIQFIEGEPPREETLCECGHTADTHDPCCVSACGCDGFEPRKVSIEELFKAVMREIKDLAQGALGYDQICDPIQAVRRLAQEFQATKTRAEKWELRFKVRCRQADERDSEVSDQFTLVANAEREARTRITELEQRLCIMVERAENREAQLVEAKRNANIVAGAMRNLVKEREQAYKDIDMAKRYADAAEARAADLAKALKVYANRSMWVKYERDGEDTASIFIGNEAGLEDGVLCDGWRFAQSALRQSEGGMSE